MDATEERPKKNKFDISMDWATINIPVSFPRASSCLIVLCVSFLVQNTIMVYNQTGLL